MHVRAALAPVLTGADVDRRHAEVRALPDPDARVADEARAVVEQPQEVGRRHVLEEVDVVGALALRGRPGCRSTCRPHRRRRSARTTASADPSARRRAAFRPPVRRLLRTRSSPGAASRPDSRGERSTGGPTPPYTLERIEVEARIGEDLRDEVDRRAAGDEHRRRVLAHPDHPFGGLLGRDEVQVGELGDAWRTFSSIEPVTSPPCTCASGMFMYAAATAVASVS